MARGGMATAAIVGIVVVVLVGAGVFGYMYLVPSNHNSSTTSQTATYLPTSISTSTTSSTTPSNLVISNAALSNSSLLVTIQNTGSQPVSLSALLVTPGSGACSFIGPGPRVTNTTTTTARSNQTRVGFALPACMTQSAVFLVQSNSTLKAIPLGQFNFTGGFNSTTFSRSFSANFSRTFSANFSRTISGNFTRGFPGNSSGFFGANFTAGGGLTLSAGQSVTLAYAGPIGSGVTAGSQYTIMVTGLQADATITVEAT